MMFSGQHDILGRFTDMIFLFHASSQRTELGYNLSLSYDNVKTHECQIYMNTRMGAGAEFTII